MSDGGKSNVEPYKVGYGKPPAEHQFRKGRSGNPRGRPRGNGARVPKANSLDAALQPANRLLLEEAYRKVNVREGDEIVQLSAMQAVFRAMGMSAIKGNRFAQRTLAQMVQHVEEEDRQVRMEHLKTAIEYKVSCENAIERARRSGLPEPQPLPHPDDVIIDFVTGQPQYHGPRTNEEKQEWDMLIARRDEAQSEVTLAATQYRRARSQTAKDGLLRDLHSEQRIFDAINDQLPPRYQVQLKDRSWVQGASLPGQRPNRWITG